MNVMKTLLPTGNVQWTSFVFFSLTLLGFVLAEPIVEYPDIDLCLRGTARGASTFCCDGNCIDNTFIGTPGQCQNYSDFCVDGGAPSCGQGQVQRGGYSESSNEYEGSCYGNDQCEWSHWTWIWDCCPCPTNYTAIGNGICADNSKFKKDLGKCFGCSDPHEQIKFNDISGSYYCDGDSWRKKACDLINDNSKALSLASTVASMLGGLCPFGASNVADWVGNVGTLFQSGSTLWNLYQGNGAYTGIDGRGVAAVSSAASFFSSMLVSMGLAGASIADGFAGAYLAACLADSLIGDALTALQDYGASPACPQAGSKRSLAMVEVKRQIEVRQARHGSHLLPRQTSSAGNTTTVNPCNDFLANFDGTDFTSPHGLFDSCNTLLNDDLIYTTDPNVAGEFKILYGLCTNITNYPGNYYVVLAFSNFVQAIQSVAPQCGPPPPNSTSLSTLPITMLTSTSTSTVLITTSTPKKSTSNTKPTTASTTTSSIPSTRSSSSSGTTSTSPSTTTVKVTSTTTTTTTKTSSSSTKATSTTSPTTSTSATKKSSTTGITSSSSSKVSTTAKTTTTTTTISSSGKTTSIASSTTKKTSTTITTSGKTTISTSSTSTSSKTTAKPTTTTTTTKKTTTTTTVKPTTTATIKPTTTSPASSSTTSHK